MKRQDPEHKKNTSIEENLKKALTELLILFLFKEGDHYIGELAPILQERSYGVLSITFPYAAIYRMTRAEYLEETKKRTAPDGRLRQYYRITPAGRIYLDHLLEDYQHFFLGVNQILFGKETP